MDDFGKDKELASKGGRAQFLALAFRQFVDFTALRVQARLRRRRWNKSN
jgi:hypothetical protein